MTRDELLDYLVRTFPSFAVEWQSPKNLFIEDDGSFTAHGVCSKFAGYFEEHGAAADPETWAELFRRIESVVAADPNDFDLVANAICTCFLEGIAQTTTGERAKRFMGPFTRRFFDYWHVSPRRDVT